MLTSAQIQFNPTLGDLKANLYKVQALLEQAKDAQLIILPELANSGYNFENRAQAVSIAETVKQSNYVEMLAGFSKQHNTTIVTGFHEKEGNELFNSSLLIKPDGSIDKYRKIHLFMKEKQIFSRGNLGLPVFEVYGFRLGMLICFDYLFPEIWRIMGLKGAHLIAHPSNLVTYKAFKVVPAQSVINRFFVFTTNRIGTERDISFSGRSFVTDPEGDVIAEASADQEESLITHIDPKLSENKMLTTMNHVLDDRIPELYQEILNKRLQ